MTRLLAIMGSGETAPTMVKPHRQLFERLGPAADPAVLLDTPYGFQENADDISARAVEYFANSVGRAVRPLDLRRTEGADVVRTEAALARLAEARWVFSGPGSPTYALRQWAGTDVPDLLADKLAHGGCVVFASAAALTLGRFTVPVYEVYKVGADPAWVAGLDLLDDLVPDVAVIPHYNNAEGGNHDTRFCYLGERRLRLLEAQLPDSGWVLGVDEHTGCVFDLDIGVVAVVGNGVVTVRRGGHSELVASGETLAINDLVGLAFGERAAGVPPPPPPAPPSEAAPTALHEEIRSLEADFDVALRGADTDAAVRAILALDETLVAWSGDTTQSDAADRGHAALRRMVTRLGDLARAGARDPREVVGGFVEVLLEERSVARSSRRFDDGDRIRDALALLGIEVRDTPEGTEWRVSPPDEHPVQRQRGS